MPIIIMILSESAFIIAHYLRTDFVIYVCDVRNSRKYQANKLKTISKLAITTLLVPP